MVRQHENTERRVETITDIRMEPIPVAFVIGESDAVLHPEAPAEAVVGGIATVRTAAGESFRHAGLADEAIRSQGLLVAAQIERRRVKRAGPHQVVELVAAGRYEVIPMVERVSGRNADRQFCDPGLKMCLAFVADRTRAWRKSRGTTGRTAAR